MKRLLPLIILLLVLSACHSSSPQTKQAAAKRPTYRIGYMICNSENETESRFRPLTAYLSQKLGVNFEMKAIDTTDFVRQVDNLDFTHTNSLLYIIMNRLHGVEVLATEKKDALGSLSQGVIFTLAKSKIKTVEDLNGKSMLFGPPLAPTGFMSQVDVLLKHGINPDKDLSFYSVPKGSFKHEQVIYGVMYGKYDAGAVPLADLQNMAAENKISLDDFRIIAKAEPIPYCNFAVNQRVDAALAKRFKAALLALTPETTVDYDGERVKVLSRALITGYEAAQDKEFDAVREMAKRTNMPPYQKY